MNPLNDRYKPFLARSIATVMTVAMTFAVQMMTQTKAQTVDRNSLRLPAGNRSSANGQTLNRNQFRLPSRNPPFGNAGQFNSGNSSFRTLSTTAGISPFVPGYGYGYGGFGGYGGYGGYGNFYGSRTAYGTAAAARARLSQAQNGRIRAKANAAESRAEATKTMEDAREKYLDNVAHYAKLRDEIRERRDAAKEQEEREQKERRQKNLAHAAEMSPTDFYPRLPRDLLDSEEGILRWPRELQDDRLAAGRRGIEKLLSLVADYGMTQSAATQLQESAEQMKDDTAFLIKEIGFQEYREMREFLSSLSVEGFYVLEEN